MPSGAHAESSSSPVEAPDSRLSRSFRLPLGRVRYVEAAAHYCLFNQGRQSVRIRFATNELEALLRKSIQRAAETVPDRQLNPVYSLESYYAFIDWSSRALPWAISPAEEYSLLYDRIDPEKYGGFLQIESAKTDTGDLNYKINRFSNYFNRVTDAYSYPMIYGSSDNIFDTVRDILAERYQFRYDPMNFYQSYGYYTMGELDMLQYRKKPVYIYQKYFDNDYILYNNPAYMSLFNQYYDGYLYYSPFISKDLLDRTINESPDYPTLFNEVGRDPKLANARLRELVIIKNLIGFLDNEEFEMMKDE